MEMISYMAVSPTQKCGCGAVVQALWMTRKSNVVLKETTCTSWNCHCERHSWMSSRCRHVHAYSSISLASSCKPPSRSWSSPTCCNCTLGDCLRCRELERQKTWKFVGVEVLVKSSIMVDILIDVGIRWASLVFMPREAVVVGAVERISLHQLGIDLV